MDHDTIMKECGQLKHSLSIEQERNSRLQEKVGLLEREQWHGPTKF